MTNQITLTKQQTKLFNMMKEGDCLVDTGRRWGKTVAAQILAVSWSENTNTLIVEPNSHHIDIFIEGLKEMIGDNIKSIDHGRHIVRFKNGKEIRLISTDFSDWTGLFRNIDNVIIEEYVLLTNNFKFKRFLMDIPKKVHKCIISTPDYDPKTYLLRKYMFSSDSFHYYRFPTPEELIPEDLRKTIPDDIFYRKYEARIPVDPISDKVNVLESCVISLARQIEGMQRDLKVATDMLNTIKEFTLEC